MTVSEYAVYCEPFCFQMLLYSSKTFINIYRSFTWSRLGYITPVLQYLFCLNAVTRNSW